MKFIRRCALAGLLACSILRSSGQVDYTFTGAVSTNWFDAANWSVGGFPATQIPGPNDNVTIGPNRLTAVITNDVTVNDLTILNLGALDGTGNITVNGTFDFNSTVANQNPKISGTSTLYVNGSMNVRGSCSLARGLDNLGTLALLQSGGVGPAKLLCATNISIQNLGAITLEDLTAIDGGASIHNLASAGIQKPTGTNVAYLGESSSIPGPNLATSPDSRISVGSGTLSLYAASNSFSVGEYHAESNAALLLHALHTLSGQITGGGVCRADGTVSINSTPGLTVTGTLELDAGGVMESANFGQAPGQLVVTNGGALVLAGGTLNQMAVNSSGAMFSSGAIVISGPATTTLTKSAITNGGTTSWQGAGNVVDGDGTTGTSMFVNSGQFTDYDDHAFDVYFINRGTFVKTLADPTHPTGPGSQTTDFIRSDCQGGVIRVESGTLSIASGSVDSSTLATTGSAVLAFQFSGVTMTGNTLATTTPTSEVRVSDDGVLNITSNATLEVSGNFRLIGNQITGPGTLLVSYGKFFFDGGSLAVSNVVTDGGVITTNTVQNAGQGMFSLTFNNGGIFAMSGPVPMTGTLFNNAPGGVVNVIQDLDLTGSSSSVHNYGALTVFLGATARLPSTQNGGSMTVDGVVYSSSLENDGSISDGGAIDLTGTLTQPLDIFIVGSNGTVTVTTFNLAGGKIYGPYGAVINGNLINNSTSGVDPPLVNGNYTSTSNGTVTIHIGGLTPVTQYDQFNVIGSAALDGTLNVSLTNGFVPTLGNQFRVMTFGSRTGTFAVKNGLKLANGLFLMPIYSSTNLTLVATNAVFIQPAIQASRGPAAGSIQLTWPSISGQAYQVQFSPDLVHWFVETNLLGFGPALSFSDATTPPAPQARFYRLR